MRCKEEEKNKMFNKITPEQGTQFAHGSALQYIPASESQTSKGHNLWYNF